METELCGASNETEQVPIKALMVSKPPYKLSNQQTTWFNDITSEMTKTNWLNTIFEMDESWNSKISHCLKWKNLDK